MSKNPLKKIPSFVINLFICGVASSLMAFVLMPQIAKIEELNLSLALLTVLILGLGVYTILKIAVIIEETTSILKDKVKIAGGLLQAVGTAFPDMIIGVVAAIASVQAESPEKKLAFAIIAAAATFGSNIYNIGFGAWCVWRQNCANHQNKKVKMFVYFGKDVTPMSHHSDIPQLAELDNANALLTGLSILTFATCILMVVFGNHTNPVLEEAYKAMKGGDLYQLSPISGLLLILAAGYTIYRFRHNTSEESEADEHNPFASQSTIITVLALLISGVFIYLTASSMVQAVEHISHLTKFPLVLAGALSGLIGCLGEMVVVHNFTTNPKGKIGDSLVGIAMDNIITLMGASIVAILGGVFLGGGDLIVIFCGVLFLNTILLLQISTLKNEYVDVKHK